ncbi:MAG: AcrR family transcriptional regulator [Polyangiales bacterium]|jgi:AcrR family transcriptional regulator
MAQQRKVQGRDEIAAAALALIDEEGLGALTMRKVGASLGVEAMTLYGYVKNRDDLLSAVHALLMSKVQPPSQSGVWVTDALCFARRFREALMAHPNAVPVVATRAATQGPALDLLEAALQAIPGDAADVNRAAFIVQTLFVFVVGHCSFHAALAASEVPVALDAERHPRLVTLRPWTAEAEFERGLEILAAGLRAK